MAEVNRTFVTLTVHPLITKLINDLTFNQLYHKKLGLPALPVSQADIRKGVWLTSILAFSDVDEHRNKAQVLASLLYLQYPDNLSIRSVVYVLFSRIGNLTGTALLKDSTANTQGLVVGKPDNSDFYDSALSIALSAEKVNKTIKSGREEILTTRFQKDLWVKLSSNNRVIISAPTSSGKSFIIKKFLKEELRSHKALNAVYVVPTRALLNQVSEDLRNEVDLSKVTIKTVFINNQIDSSYNIFILTPERCLRLLRYSWEHEFKLDFIFIDEIQNVEDTQGRGALFEFVYKEMFNLFESSRIIAAGPNIDNPGGLFSDVFGDVGVPIDTMSSPVFQIKSTIKLLDDNKIEVIASTVPGTSQSVVIQTDTDFLKKFSKSTGEGMKHLINIFGSEDQNIIYSPQGNWAADWALKFAETLPVNPDLDPWIKEIIDFLTEEIHPDYQLIACLKKGVAYHHGNLPDIVRKEIEDCFLEGKIQNLFCTSTLLQGVNLPANNLFIPMAKKESIDLTPFEFGNLMGRAGRIRSSLYGSIYCIERNSEKEWSQEMYSISHKKPVQTAGQKYLENPDQLLQFLSSPINEVIRKKDSSAVVFFRQKFARSPEELKAYLVKNNLAPEKIEEIENQLQSSTVGLKIPLELLKQNPTIDPEFQDKLYQELMTQGLENWLVPSRAENPNMYKLMSAEERDGLPFSSWSFYWQLESIIARLDAIFFMASEAYFRNKVSVSSKQICFLARQWLTGKSLRQLIDSDIKFYNTHVNPKKRVNINDLTAVNQRINEVIKTNSVVTTHILIRTMKLLNDLAESFLDEPAKEKYRFALALPTMVELGTTEPAVVTLISCGVSRSIALKIFTEYKRFRVAEDQDIIVWLGQQEKLKLKPIYNRYLIRMRLLKQIRT